MSLGNSGIFYSGLIMLALDPPVIVYTFAYVTYLHRLYTFLCSLSFSCQDMFGVWDRCMHCISFFQLYYGKPLNENHISIRLIFYHI